MPKNAALILAAGKGTRMHSDRPKVLQTILGEPMLAYVRAALRPVFAEDVWMVVGHRAQMVEAAFPDARLVFQTEQLGTGHALMQALPGLTEAGCTHLLVVNGDAPLLSEALVRDFLAEAGGADLAFATILPDNPGAYGRVVRKQGRVLGIVEAKDYDPARHGPESGEVNAGMYWLSLAAVETLLPRLNNDNKSGEYYITDIIGLAVAENYTVRGVECGRDDSLLGVNSPLELSRMEEMLRARTAEQLLASGVILHAPDLVRVSPLARVEPGAELSGPCEICGRTEIRRGARKELLENYVKRLEDLEGIATSFDGVTKAYAIQAGREIRVMVNSENVDDDTTYLLCKDIAEKIEKNLTYPGQIRVTVIRERRAVGFAK